MGRSSRVLKPFAALALVLSLATCSYFGWGGAGESSVEIRIVRPSAMPAGSRAVSGAGGALQIPDFLSYDLSVTAPDMDPISATNGTGVFSIKVPVSASINRLFILKCRTTQALFSASASQLINGPSTVTLSPALDSGDLFLTVNKGGTARVARASVDPSTGVVSAIADVQAGELRSPALAAFANPLSPSFVAGDAALDAEGFLYLSDDFAAPYLANDPTPRILKIRDANTASLVASDVFFTGSKSSDSPGGTGGIFSIAIDRARGIMYFARQLTGWFYKKSLLINDGSDQSSSVERIDLPIGGWALALDLAPNGDIVVLQDRPSSIRFITRYQANPGNAANALSGTNSGSTPPENPIDIQVIGSYVYVLASASPAIQRYDLADLAAAPTTGGVVGTGTSAGTFEGATRFLTGPGGRVFVKVLVGGKPGVVSFTDMSGWAGWSYKDFDADLP
jgi:hypothetical protein